MYFSFIYSSRKLIIKNKLIKKITILIYVKESLENKCITWKMLRDAHKLKKIVDRLSSVQRGESNGAAAPGIKWIFIGKWASF